jgi:competence protein ComEC
MRNTVFCGFFVFCVTLVAAVAGCTYVGGGDFREDVPLRVTFLDVGQGLAVLLELDGRYAMYDMGPDSAGVMDSLEARGVDTLDWVLLSHNHRDHAGGLLELGGAAGSARPETAARFGTAPRVGNAPRVAVKHLYVGPDTSGGFVRDSALRVARRFGIPVDTVSRGEILGFGGYAGVKAEVLWPPEYSRLGGNAASAVLRVEFGEAVALLMGDLDSAGERGLLELSPTLSTGLLQVPHHGSAGSSSLAFVGRVNPAYAVVSVGAKNRYGHPAAEVVRKYVLVLGDSSRFFRTDRDGSVGFGLYRGLGVIR